MSSMHCGTADLPSTKPAGCAPIAPGCIAQIWWSASGCREGTDLPPSATFVSGPFGEVVSYADGLIYLTCIRFACKAYRRICYAPEGLLIRPKPLTLRSSAGYPEGDGAMSCIAFAHSIPENSRTCDCKGGVIVAWGKTDIYDPASELHRRYEMGVTSAGRFIPSIPQNSRWLLISGCLRVRRILGGTLVP